MSEFHRGCLLVIGCCGLFWVAVFGPMLFLWIRAVVAEIKWRRIYQPRRPGLWETIKEAWDEYDLTRGGATPEGDITFATGLMFTIAARWFLDGLE